MASAPRYRQRLVCAAALLTSALGTERVAEADADGALPADTERAVPEAPLAPRLLHVPTAWLQSPGRLYGSTGLNHRGGIFFAVAGGAGRLAEIDVNITDRFVLCSADCAGDDRSTSDARVVSALFKVGTAQDSLFAGQPALAIGLRKSVKMTEKAATPATEPRLAELYVAASRRTRWLGLHAGAQLFDAKIGSVRLLDTDNPAKRVRPFAGLEWTPSIYPRTTLLLDLSWVPELQRVEEDSDVALKWLAGWGIRYQALSWGSIELAVRHRENDALGDSTVFVRVNGTTDLKKHYRNLRRK